MKASLIINDAPYRTEKAYNALRLAMALQSKRSDVEVLIFLMAGKVACAATQRSLFLVLSQGVLMIGSTLRPNQARRQFESVGE